MLFKHKFYIPHFSFSLSTHIHTHRHTPNLKTIRRKNHINDTKKKFPVYRNVSVFLRNGFDSVSKAIKFVEDIYRRIFTANDE